MAYRYIVKSIVFLCCLLFEHWHALTLFQRLYRTLLSGNIAPIIDRLSEESFFSEGSFFFYFDSPRCFSFLWKCGKPGTETGTSSFRAVRETYSGFSIFFFFFRYSVENTASSDHFTEHMYVWDVVISKSGTNIEIFRYFSNWRRNSSRWRLAQVSRSVINPYFIGIYWRRRYSFCFKLFCFNTNYRIVHVVP